MPSNNTHKMNRSSENGPNLESLRCNVTITEQPSSENKLLQVMNPEMLCNEPENSVGDIISKSQTICSKSDYVKNSEKCMSFREGSIVLCENSLAKSEPSILTQKEKKHKIVYPSYSKLTVAKSDYHPPLANIKQNGYCSPSTARKNIMSSPMHLQSSTSLTSKTSGIKECLTSEKSADDKHSCYNVKRDETMAPCRETAENTQDNLKNCETHL